MSLSFRDLKPGGLYVTQRRMNMPLSSPRRPRIPKGTQLLVIEPVPVGDIGECQVYRVLIDGSVGLLLVAQGDVLPVEEA